MKESSNTQVTRFAIADYNHRLKVEIQSTDGKKYLGRIFIEWGEDIYIDFSCNGKKTISNINMLKDLCDKAIEIIREEFPGEEIKQYEP